MVKKKPQKKIWQKLNEQKASNSFKNKNLKSKQRKQKSDNLKEFQQNYLNQQCQDLQQDQKMNSIQEQIASIKQNDNTIFNNEKDIYETIKEKLLNVKKQIKSVFTMDIIEKYHSNENESIKKEFQSNNFECFQRLKQKQSIKLFIEQKQKYKLKDFQPQCYKKQMLNVSRIKFLNIYGSVGVGKTYLMKNLIQQQNLSKRCIWINGLNLLQHKSNKLSQQTSQIIEHWLRSILGYNQNYSNITSLILIIDEYDQIHHLDFLQLIKYAYSTHINENYHCQESHPLLLIQKVLLISNYHIKEQFNTGKSSISKLIKRHRITVEQLFFSPFKDNQIFQIIQKKINIINKYFNTIFEVQAKQIHKKQVFDEQHVKFVIKKIALQDNNDIRKTLAFFNQVYQQWFKQQNFTTIFMNNKKELISNQYIDAFINVFNQKSEMPLTNYLRKINKQQKIVLTKLISLIMLKKKRVISQKYAIIRNENKFRIKRNYKGINYHTKYQKTNSLQIFNIVYLQQLYPLLQNQIKLNRLCLILKDFEEIGLLVLQTNQKQTTNFKRIFLIDNWKIKFQGDVQSIYKILNDL